MYRNHPYYEEKKCDGIRQMLDVNSVKFENKTAIEYIKQGQICKKSYKELSEEVKALGTALAALKEGASHVALIGKNSPEWISVCLTVLGGKGVLVPIDHSLCFEDIVKAIDETDATTVFYHGELEDDFVRAYRGKDGQVKYFVNVDKCEKDEDGCFFSLRGLVRKGKNLLAMGDKSYTHSSLDTGGQRLFIRSGSRWIMICESGLVAGVCGVLERLELEGRILSLLGMDTATGITQGIIAPLWSGATLCVGGVGDKRVSEYFKAFKPETAMMTPASARGIYEGIWKNAEQTNRKASLERLLTLSRRLVSVGIDKTESYFGYIKRYFGSRLGQIVCFGALADRESAEFFEDIGIKFHEAFSIAECSGVVSISCGKSAEGEQRLIGCLECKTTQANARGQTQILLKGDSLMMGYYKNDVATESVFDESGWFHTDYYGHVDSKKRLMIHGEKTGRLTLESGKRVSLFEIERRILQTGVVSSAKVYGIYDGHKSAVSLGAAVSLSDKCEILSEDEKQLRVKNALEEMNKRLPTEERVKKVRIKTKK